MAIGIRARVLAAATALAVVPLGAGSHAAAYCGGPTLETFEVRTKWNKKVYAPGETVKVQVTVLRPAKKDPSGQGIPLDPPQQHPVEDAKVWVAFTVGVPPVFGIGYTNEDGTLLLKIPLRKDIRGGVEATTRASKMYNESGPDCTNVEEFGHKREYPAFYVR
ncbi:MAG: hypothetical protein M3273_04140 [Actinomycetota bacterium]|nr:hypothetical protein [Actinomycetota bacterium]